MVALWIHLLLEANYVEKNWKGTQLKPGTFPTSIKKISEKTGLSTQQTRTCLSNLQTTREITIKSTNKYSLITIVKWADYQVNDEISTNKITNNQHATQQTNNKQPNNTIRNKNNKNKEIIYIKGSNEFIEAFNDFKEMRKKIRKPLTQRAEQMIINRLNQLSNDEETQIEILNQSILNGWQNVYPLKNKREDIVTTYDTSKNPKYDESRFNEIMERRKNVS